MTSLRQRQKELTRQTLMDAGFSLFTSKGYGATTVEDIAQEAGTTRATFYAHFPSRGELLKALLTERLNGILERSRRPDRSRAEGLVKTVELGTREAISDWVRHTAESWPDIHPYIRMGRDASAVDPDIGDIIACWLEEPVSDIEEGLANAGRGAPRTRHFLGVLAMAELDYVAQHWATSDWGLSREEMLETFIDSWHRLLGG